MSLLSYKGYYGTIETEENILIGHVLGLKNTIISYEGATVKELKQDFKNGIDDYLSTCQADHTAPEKPSYAEAKGEWDDILAVAFA